MLEVAAQLRRTLELAIGHIAHFAELAQQRGLTGAWFYAATCRAALFIVSARNRVDSQPRVLNLGCEIGSQALLERPQQRLGNHIVVLVLHAVSRMATAQVLNDRHELRQLLETAYRQSDGRHQFPALRLEVAFEQWPHLRCDFEQPPVEQTGGLVGDRRNLGEALFEQLDPLRRDRSIAHFLSSIAPRRGCVSMAGGCPNLEPKTLRCAWFTLKVSFFFPQETCARADTVSIGRGLQRHASP